MTHLSLKFLSGLTQNRIIYRGITPIKIRIIKKTISIRQNKNQITKSMIQDYRGQLAISHRKHILFFIDPVHLKIKQISSTNHFIYNNFLVWLTLLPTSIR
jgi:hypothetical protein